MQEQNLFNQFYPRHKSKDKEFRLQFTRIRREMKWIHAFLKGISTNRSTTIRTCETVCFIVRVHFIFWSGLEFFYITMYTRSTYPRVYVVNRTKKRKSKCFSNIKSSCNNVLILFLPFKIYCPWIVKCIIKRHIFFISFIWKKNFFKVPNWILLFSPLRKVLKVNCFGLYMWTWALKEIFSIPNWIILTIFFRY